MAVRPDIALQTQAIDTTAALVGGQSAAEQIKTQGIREAMLNQQAANSVLEGALLQQRQQSNELAIQDAQAKQTQAQALILNQLFKTLQQTPEAQRAGVAARALPQLQGFGIGSDVVGQIDVSDKGLEEGIAATSAFTKSSAAANTSAVQNFQYFNSILADPNATEDQKRAARIALGTEASAGRAQVKEVSPGVYQTFDPNSNAFGNPFKYGPNGEQLPLTRSEQQGLRLGEDVNAIQTKGEATTAVEVDKQRKLNELALDKELAETDMKDLNVRRKTFISQGVAAKDSIPNIERMIELNNRIVTGGATALTKAVTDFMGMTSADIGEFNRRSSELVLGTIRQLGANPTEGERSFLEKIQPSVGQSNEVNAAILADLKVIAQRQSDRAKKLQANPSLDPNELILNEPDFAPSYNGGGIRPAQSQQVSPSTKVPVDANGNTDNKAYVDSLFN